MIALTIIVGIGRSQSLFAGDETGKIGIQNRIYLWCDGLSLCRCVDLSLCAHRYELPQQEQLCSKRGCWPAILVR